MTLPHVNGNPDPALAQARVDARKCYRTLEPLHAFIYFSPQAFARYADAGLKDAWMYYFAPRSAAFGPVGADVVTATFYNFAPSVVEHAIPEAWTLASPERILDARHAAVDEALTPVLAQHADAAAEADEILADAVSDLEAGGRPLYAAHAGLPTPEAAALRLWHRITLLREWRGDGHVAVLTAEGVDPCEVLHIAGASGASLSMLKATRGWSDEEWDAARARLVENGVLTAEGELTEAGAAHRQHVEDRTDALAAAPWLRIGPERSARLRELLRPISVAVVESSGMGSVVPAPSR